MYKPLYSKRFEKQIKKFPEKEQIKILQKINQILGNPKQSAIKLESTAPIIYRIRVGEYRIFFELDDQPKTIIFTHTERRTTQTYRKNK